MEIHKTELIFKLNQVLLQKINTNKQANCANTDVNIPRTPIMKSNKQNRKVTTYT